MALSTLRNARFAATASAMMALVFCTDSSVQSQAKKVDPKPVGEILQPAPRPKKPALAASKCPLP